MKRMLGLLTAAALVAASAGTASAAQPDPLPSFSVEGAFHSAAAKNDHLYLAAKETRPGEPDILIFRISGQSGAEKAGEITANVGALGITLSGDRLYLAQGDRGLEVIDVSQPSHPRSLAALPLEGYSHEVAVSGPLALVAAGFHGLHIVDISKPDRPMRLSSLQAYPPPQDASTRESGATDDEGGLSFAKQGEAEENGRVFGDTAEEYFSADDLPAFQDVDEGEITAEMIRDREGALDVASDGRYAYIAYGSAGLFVVDISDPVHPRKAALFPTHRAAERLALQRDRLVVSTGVGGVLIIDVSRPEQPRLLNTLRTNCYPMDVAAGGGGRVYIADGYCGSDGLLVFDIGNPQQPKKEQSFSDEAGRVQLLNGHIVTMGRSKINGYTL